ncbi:hypothetical protein Pst134EA_032942 [Puccinia striiformis f. sp. tritici]|uniref:uncharacterized protein n=1 Tax=Puccinia striiformis f. sp. tritici TaxID=168172 RepID=UPI0020082434|nr:uncharacterized protein Pst134EA_032942 [Puccinia striiformis f. sp. tritici]KAH9441507.1 hypothetical protein Pst134EA_032942 [Puccinia striiformis f. sp. tritici]
MTLINLIDLPILHSNDFGFTFTTCYTAKATIFIHDGVSPVYTRLTYYLPRRMVGVARWRRVRGGCWEQDPGLKAVLKEYDSDRRGRTSRQRRVGISSGGGGSSCGVAEGAMVKGGEVLAILEERVMHLWAIRIALKLY